MDAFFSILNLDLFRIVGDEDFFSLLKEKYNYFIIVKMVVYI